MPDYSRLVLYFLCTHPLVKPATPLRDAFKNGQLTVLTQLSQYRKNAHYNATHRRRQNLYALPTAQWQMLAAAPIFLLDTLSAVDDAIDLNADLADEILRIGLASLGLAESPPKQSALNWRGTAQPNDMSKAHSTLRQFYRDWSHEGYSVEVKPLLDVILSDLRSFLPDSTDPASLLLPGAGLGRLLFELCLAGFDVQGNEISYHQLLASNFILNTTQHANQYPLYPFATTFTNVVSRSNQLRRVTIPDTHPATAIAHRLESGGRVGEMNMTAGDFVLSYAGPSHEGLFDAVVTVYFIDTAPNLLRYISTVRNTLKKDGLWINIGPLLWHFDDRVHGQGRNEDSNGDTSEHGHRHDGGDDDDTESPLSHSHSHSHSQPPSETQLHAHPHPHGHLQETTAKDEDKGIAEPGSFELTDDEVLSLLQQTGFVVESHEILDSSLGGYIRDPTSMLQSRYRCSHWVARKSEG